MQTKQSARLQMASYYCVGDLMRYGTAVALVLLAGLIWSLNGLFIRMLEAATTWQVLFWRSAGVVPALLIWVVLRSPDGPLASLGSLGRSGIVAGLGLVVAFGGAIYAIQATTVANAVFLFSASPFLTAILGRIALGESVRRATWVAMMIAGIGMYIMVRDGLAAGALLGNIAALCSALGFSVFTVSLRWGKMSDMRPAIILGAVFSMITAAIVLLGQAQTIVISGHDTAISLFMGAFIIAAGMALYTAGSRVIAAAELTILSMVEILLAPVWVWLFFDETASSATLLGGLILLFAVAFNAVTGARRKPIAPVIN